MALGDRFLPKMCLKLPIWARILAWGCLGAQGFGWTPHHSTLYTQSVAPWTLVKAVLNVSSIGCDNERQLFVNLSYNAIYNVLTNLLPVGLQDFFQMVNVSKATTTVNKLMECSPDWVVHWVKVRATHCTPFLTHKALINALSSLVNGRVFVFTSNASVMTSHRILINA